MDGRRHLIGRSSRWLWMASGAFGLVVVAAFIWIQKASPPPSPSSGVIAEGAAAPTIAQPSTSGPSLSLNQFNGKKVVVYFYEGAG
jgi:hypothetical protein